MSREDNAMPANRLHILIVEDEEAHIEAIRRAFASSAMEVTITKTDSLAGYRTAIAAGTPDIALMDLNLADGRATEAMVFPPEAGAFPIVVMTSHGNELLAVQAIKSGAIDYIVKSPEAFAGMPRSVERALWEWALLEERKRAEADKEKLQEQLAQAQKMEVIGRLAGGVAHDFNNMLGVILGYTEMLKFECTGTLEQEGLLAIEKAAQRSRDITSQLLAFSRKQFIAPRPLDLNQVITDSTKTLARLIGEDVTLRLDLAKDLGLIKMDPAQLHQILLNLAANARDAMPDGGEITLATRSGVLDEAYCRNLAEVAPGFYVVLTAQDTGCGMDQETLAHIFEPFFTTKGVGKGTGLGLATIYGIVKQNKGHVEVDSKAGKGTAFTLYFPCLAEPMAKPLSEAEPQAPSGAGTILVVEDEEMLRSLLTAMLGRLGYNVVVTSSAEEAMALFDREGPSVDLLITDVVLPTMNGKDLSKSLRLKKPGLKTLFISGFTADILARKGLMDDDLHFLPKPFTRAEIGRKIKELLAFSP